MATLRDWYRAGVDVAARLPALSAYLGHAHPASTYWYLHRRPGPARPGGRTPRTGRQVTAVSALAPTLEAFFTDRLLTQRQVSPRTVAAYRDTLRLLLGFAQQRTGTPPCRLDLADLDADLIAAFLTHLERDRRNGVRTRNARLAAIHSLFRYAALRHPEHAASIARVLAIPAKRYDRTLVCFLTRAEVDALLAAPTGRPGSDAAITPCWSSPSRPGCGSANSPRSPSPTCTSGAAAPSAAPGRAARNAPPR